MSPRRTSEETERLGRDARRTLIEQARVLQASLMEICDRVESIKSEHSKLEGENRFLQNYIGELMQTTKITATGASKGKGKARAIR
jgi:predicted nuclease with TOPRIM domain